MIYNSSSDTDCAGNLASVTIGTIRKVLVTNKSKNKMTKDNSWSTKFISNLQSTSKLENNFRPKRSYRKTGWGTIEMIQESSMSLRSSELRSLIKDNTLIFDLEPLHSIFLCHSVLDTNSGLAPTTATHTISRALQNNIEVHTVNTS